MIYEIDPKDYVLKPTSFALIIKRNLSSGWYKDLPQIEISGRLHSIELNIIAQDYKVIMQILEKNMTEGQNEFKKPRQPRSVTATVEPSKGEIRMNLFWGVNINSRGNSCLLLKYIDCRYRILN